MQIYCTMHILRTETLQVCKVKGLMVLGYPIFCGFVRWKLNLNHINTAAHCSLHALLNLLKDLKLHRFIISFTNSVIVIEEKDCFFIVY